MGYLLGHRKCHAFKINDMIWATVYITVFLGNKEEFLINMNIKKSRSK